MTKLKLLFSCICILCTIIGTAQFKPLSPQAQISVLTIEPGLQLNDAFGHSAFRIKDTLTQTDVVFDYGRYDFTAPNFYLNFAKGKLNYKIGASHFKAFRDAYKRENRGITEQVLNLNTKDKEQLYKFLIYNYKPENQTYKYDFFYNNCATKIKDVLQNKTEQTIIFNAPKNLKPATFRDLIHEHVSTNSWGSFGIDLALGSVIDQTITPENYMFLPKYINVFFDEATLNNTPLVSRSNQVVISQPKNNNSNSATSPLVIISILSLIILWITYKDFKQKQRTKVLDIFIFACTGVIGVVLLLLWFATDHTATANNYNLLWAFFLNLLVLPQVITNTPKLWFKKYIKFLIILLVLMAFHWITGVQVFNSAVLPLIVALAMRYVFLITHLNYQYSNSKSHNS